MATKAPKLAAPKTAPKTRDLDADEAGPAESSVPTAHDAAQAGAVGAGDMPPAANTEGQLPGDGAQPSPAEPEPAVTAAGAPTPNEPGSPEGDRQGAPESETGEAGEGGAGAAPSLADSIEAVAAQRAVVRYGIEHVAATGQMPALIDLGGVLVDVLAWRLADDALIVVSMDGRKYRLDRESGRVADTATEQVLV